MKRIPIVLITAMASMSITTTTAEAHEIKRIDCARYAAMHAFTTGSKSVRRPAFLKCWRNARRHLMQHPLPDSMIPYMLRRIRGCESGSGPNGRPNYKAQNKISTASGAYQYLDSTWSNHLGYKKARHAPPRVQDNRAVRDFNSGGSGPWLSSKGCWG